jgi:hypothetical protein
MNGSYLGMGDYVIGSSYPVGIDVLGSLHRSCGIIQDHGWSFQCQTGRDIICVTLPILAYTKALEPQLEGENWWKLWTVTAEWGTRSLHPSSITLQPITFILHLYASPLILQSYRRSRSLTLMKPFSYIIYFKTLLHDGQGTWQSS